MLILLNKKPCKTNVPAGKPPTSGVTATDLVVIIVPKTSPAALILRA